jgi:hypothetical protein
MQAEWFEEFARQLLDAKGVAAPNDEVRQQLVKDISERARDVVLRQLLDDLDENELKQLDQATDSGDTATADRIIAQHQGVITSALQQFKGMYLARA